MIDVLIFDKQEFDSFKEELLSQIQKLQSVSIQNTWLRSKNVRKMLCISDSTLQTMRINGTIPSYKLGTSWFYRHDEIVAALEANKTGRKEVSNG